MQTLSFIITPTPKITFDLVIHKLPTLSRLPDIAVHSSPVHSTISACFTTNTNRHSSCRFGGK